MAILEESLEEVLTVKNYIGGECHARLERLIK